MHCALVECIKGLKWILPTLFFYTLGQSFKQFFFCSIGGRLFYFIIDFDGVCICAIANSHMYL